MDSVTPIVMPLYFAAPLSWYAEVFDKQEIVLMNDHKFPRQTYRQRFDYVTVEGARTFSIPLVKDTRNLDYRSVEISYQTHWQNQLINALRTSYGKSPFFEYYDYRFERIIAEKHRYLWDLNMLMLKETLACLKLDIRTGIHNEPLPFPEPEPIDTGRIYYQVFADKAGFFGNMTILDLIFNEGINAWSILSGDKSRI
jgi:hypothetical protein